MYFDEEVILDVRLNVLDQFVDYFVIVESRFTHKGDQRNLKFNIQKFNKFKDKIIYLIYEDQPKEVKIIKREDGIFEKTKKYVSNAIYRENGQRNHIKKGLIEAKDNDIILISDVDEIPNLSNVNFNKINEKIILFKQKMFYYKFNLYLPNLAWSGTKACKKKDLLNPQWLRNIKDRNYSFFRIDTLFSKTKYKNIKIFNNGGWHFTNIKTAKEIEYKLKSYLHHREFDVNPLTINQIDEIIKDKRAIYNLNVDKSISKIGNGNKLKKFEISKLPIYIQKNLNNLKQWIE
jgi:beta-1,4-mannosyl-glycoprotein beta-1,4-N-acetylglucosaminyltransferase|tara:strand:- start:179 stop:1048 length:870 start_codon:yes stop_codon:yes gene_type:complete